MNLSVKPAAAFRLLPVFLALALAACGSGSGTGTDGRATATGLTVRAVVPQQRSWPRHVTASGAIAPWQEVVISAQTGSVQIISIRADVGDYVRKSEVLATLDRKSLLATQAQRQAEIAQSQANLAQASSDVRRAALVASSGALSAQQIEQYRVNEQVARANLAAARAQLQGVEIQLRQTGITAADDGIVSSRSALLGKVVSTGEELFRLVRRGILEWQVELDARQLASVRGGQVARLTLPGGQVVQGQVRLVSPTLSNTTSRGIAYVRLPAGSAAKAGMYGTGVIETGAALALTVPDTAVVLRDGRSYVFLLEDNRARQRQVQTGRRREGRVEIISGLPGNARIVETGGAFLSDGVAVRVPNSGAPVR